MLGMLVQAYPSVAINAWEGQQQRVSGLKIAWCDAWISPGGANSRNHERDQIHPTSQLGHDRRVSWNNNILASGCSSPVLPSSKSPSSTSLPATIRKPDYRRPRWSTFTPPTLTGPATRTGTVPTQQRRAAMDCEGCSGCARRAGQRAVREYLAVGHKGTQ